MVIRGYPITHKHLRVITECRRTFRGLSGHEARGRNYIQSNLPLTTKVGKFGRLKIDVVMEKEKTKVKSNAVGRS